MGLAPWAHRCWEFCNTIIPSYRTEGWSLQEVRESKHHALSKHWTNLLFVVLSVWIYFLFYLSMNGAVLLMRLHGKRPRFHCRLYVWPADVMRAPGTRQRGRIFWLQSLNYPANFLTLFGKLWALSSPICIHLLLHGEITHSIYLCQKIWVSV